MRFISKSTYDPYGEYKVKITEDLLQLIQKEYDLTFDFNSVQDLGGSYTRNILLITDKGKYVARVYQSYATIARILDVQKVKYYLNSEGIKTATILSTRFDKSFTSYKGMIIEVEEFLQLNDKMNTWDRIKSGIKTLAKIHDKLDHIKVSNIGENPLVANHVEVAYALPWTERGLQPLLNDNPSDEEKIYVDKSLQLAKRITETQLDIYSQLPRKLTHGDYWDNNVFMNNLEVSYVIDFDFLGKRARVDDIAYTLFSKIHGEYSEESIENIKAVLDRYDEAALTKLSRSERRAVPLSMARVPLAFIGIIASLDTREQMSNEFKSRKDSIDWSLKVLDNLEFWQNTIVS